MCEYACVNLSTQYTLHMYVSMRWTKITCFVGIKFIVITEPKQDCQEVLLRKLYEIYADYALKNPFYSIDMPIRSVIGLSLPHNKYVTQKYKDLNWFCPIENWDNFVYL